MGLPPAFIAQSRRDPQMRAMIQQRLAQLPTHSRDSSGVPEMTEDTIKQQIAAVKAQVEAERTRPLRNPPPRPRHMCIVMLNDQRGAAVAAQKKGQKTAVTSYTCIPKAFSNRELAELQPSTFTFLFSFAVDGELTAPFRSHLQRDARYPSPQGRLSAPIFPFLR